MLHMTTSVIICPKQSGPSGPDSINIDMSTYNPYTKYASSNDLSLGSLVEDWKCELVAPRHPALHTRATTDPFSGSIDWQAREREMFQLMHANYGIGLAAPQVGSNYNMFVMRHSILGDIGVYKPEILEVGNQLVRYEEGCLTWPMLYVSVERVEAIRVRYYKTDGTTIVETGMDGIDARCFLHEYDHLQGINFIDGVSEFKLRRAKEQRDKRLKRIQRSAR